MSSLLLLVLARRNRPFITLKPSAALPSFCCHALGRLYSTEHEDDPPPQGVMQKARSTGEEFLRQAKEKSDSISERGREAMEEAKEAALGESVEEKDKFKEKVEKGNYDKIGRE